MTARPNAAPCWIDLGSRDKAASAAFYGALFGWTAEESGEELGHYTTFSKDGRPVAGCMANDGSMGPDGWTSYLATDDLTKLADLATANGGQVVTPPMAVGDLGQLAFVTDPGGAFVGAWQAGEHTGFAERAVHGTPGWFELWTRDFAGALEFYREVYGAEIKVVGDSDEFRYAIITEHGEDAAGIMDVTGFLPAEVPSHWSVYFSVDDADATIAQAVELGGTLVQPAEDTPYGRLATLTDSTGATFKLVQGLDTDGDPA